MQTRKFRDLTLVNLSPSEVLVIACDSCGGIGEKPHDYIKLDGKTTGRFIARVALAEVMASGATPLVLINNLAVEMNPYGAAIMQGIQEEGALCGLGEEDITGSTEENIPTVQTAFGVTVLGLASPENLKLGKSQLGDLVVCIGYPKVGAEVTEDFELAESQITDLTIIQRLLTLDFVHEILPVGSKGIDWEARELARMSGKVFRESAGHGLNLDKSAGPVTCVLISCPEKSIELIKSTFRLPINIIGKLC